MTRPLPAGSDAAGDIFDCIQRGNTEQCAQFIQNDATVLQQKGWGGFTPLHYAALHGNRTLVDLFLNDGANPNSTCDAGQTAFHFSCRQGNIYIMHQMIKHGADLHLVDLQGKTSLHHAVSGGNIVAVQYLWETGIFRFSDKDLHKVTPLHLAASTGNTEMVQYLLRDQRCRVDAADHEGVTALHIAAERGGVEVCWMLLQTAGCWILHQKNHSGLTPLDLSKQGKTFRHQQLTKLLKQYISEPIHHKPGESHVLYYWTLLFPTLSGVAILLIAAMMDPYGGLVCSLLFPWLARSIFTQYHRMTTYQRLPNPVYLGTLMAGMFLSILCFCGRILSSVLPSALVQVSVFHVPLVLCLFCKILAQDPGKLDRADADPRFSCLAELVEDNQSPLRFCPHCELFQPDNTKHCKLCDACIKDYDHHCLFLNRCIGRGNHRLFLCLILSMVGAHLLFLASASLYLYEVAPPDADSWWSLWLSTLGAEFWVVAMMAMNALTLLWEAWLLSEQFGAISTGTTTYFKECEESARRRSIGQRWRTVVLFLLEGQRRVGVGRTGEDRISIDI